MLDPSAPEITDLEVTPSSITVRWEPGPGLVTEYAVTYDPPSFSPNPETPQPIRIGANSGSGGPMTTITGLQPGQEYTVSVKAVVNYNSNIGFDVPEEYRESYEESRRVTTCKYITDKTPCYTNMSSVTIKACIKRILACNTLKSNHYKLMFIFCDSRLQIWKILIVVQMYTYKPWNLLTKLNACHL